MKSVWKSLKTGVNKHEIFDRAIADGLMPKKVAKVISRSPDAEDARKFEYANIVLASLYTALVLHGFYIAIPILKTLPASWIGPTLALALALALAFALLLPVIVIGNIIQKRPIGYILLCIFLAQDIFDSLAELEAYPTLVLSQVAINTGLIIFAFTLKNKLFPYQNFFHMKKDEQGLAVFSKEKAPITQ